ncbi:MAG TPA: hypothetical protein VNZ49_08045 [Bacteroidia bacterium]|jgi:hypothetical protein|nr:hypothetical protein [Bacteroidia bacterium]
MKTKRPIRSFVFLFLFLVVAFSIVTFTRQNQTLASNTEAKGCVFLTVMGQERSDSDFIYNTTANVKTSIDNGLTWIAKAQQNNGGWGAGTNMRQDIIDPHAVKTDPATTAMVCMALQRSGNTLAKGEYSKQLGKGLEYLLDCVEKSATTTSTNITEETGTQIQVKLGGNIDVILTSQFLSNVLEIVKDNAKLKTRVEKCQDICVSKIQKAQESNGSFKSSGWAGVLQSSFATNALEAAQSNGAKVDDKALEKAREYQKSNFDSDNGNVNTAAGAGVVLYSVTSSNRAASQDARKVNEAVEKAKKEGKLAQNAPVTTDNLEKIGYDKDAAKKATNAYKVYNSTKSVAQDQKVMSGFGNNGGEEFLSYLQTGESMIIGKDTDWKKWYENISGHLISIKNEDGSWSGHHCITSPVFCTATCVLILTVNNDIDKLTAIGKTK